MIFLDDMNHILAEYGLLVKEAEILKFVILSPSGPIAYFEDEGEITAFISALYAVKKGRIWVGKG